MQNKISDTVMNKIKKEAYGNALCQYFCNVNEDTWPNFLSDEYACKDDIFGEYNKLRWDELANVDDDFLYDDLKNTYENYVQAMVKAIEFYQEEQHG